MRCADMIMVCSHMPRMCSIIVMYELTMATHTCALSHHLHTITWQCTTLFRQYCQTNLQCPILLVWYFISRSQQLTVQCSASIERWSVRIMYCPTSGIQCSPFVMPCYTFTTHWPGVDMVCSSCIVHCYTVVSQRSAFVIQCCVVVCNGCIHDIQCYTTNPHYAIMSVHHFIFVFPNTTCVLMCFAFSRQCYRMCMKCSSLFRHHHTFGYSWFNIGYAI